MTGRRPRSSCRSTPPPHGLGEDERAYRRPDAAVRVESAGSVFDEILRPIRAVLRRGIRSCWRASASTGLRSAMASADALPDGARARALRRLPPRIRSSRSSRCGSASFGLALMLAGHAIGWPAREGGSASITDAHGRATSAPSAARSRRRSRVRSLRDVPAAAAVLFDVTPRQLAYIAARRAAVALRQASCAASATARASSRSTSRSTDRFRGRRAECARSGDRAPRRDARGDRRARARGLPRHDDRASRSCSWRSRASSTRRARRPASTPAGRTAMCRTVRPRT